MGTPASIHADHQDAWILWHAGRLLLASGSRDGQVCLWSPDKGSLQQAVHISSSPPAPVQTRSRGMLLTCHHSDKLTCHHSDQVESALWGVEKCAQDMLILHS